MVCVCVCVCGGGVISILVLLRYPFFYLFFPGTMFDETTRRRWDERDDSAEDNNDLPLPFELKGGRLKKEDGGFMNGS